MVELKNDVEWFEIISIVCKRIANFFSSNYSSLSTHNQLVKLNVKLKLTEEELTRQKTSYDNWEIKLKKRKCEIKMKEDSEHSFRNQVFSFFLIIFSIFDNSDNLFEVTKKDLFIKNKTLKGNIT